MSQEERVRFPYVTPELILALSLGVNPEIGVDLLWKEKYAGANPVTQTECKL